VLVYKNDGQTPKPKIGLKPILSKASLFSYRQY